MKLFTGWIISAGLVVAAGAANAQVLAPYEVWALAIQGGVRYRRALCGDAAGSAGAWLRSAIAAAARGLHGAARERIFAARYSGAARLRLHDFGDRSRRRRRAAGDRRPHRADPALPAGQPDGRQFRRRADDHLVRPVGRRPPMSGASRARRAPHRRSQAVRPGCRFRSRAPAKPGRWRPRTPAVQPAQPAAVPPAQQSAAAVPAKPADPQTTGQIAAPAAAPAVEAKPAPQILPTQDMPKAQGLE